MDAKRLTSDSVDPCQIGLEHLPRNTWAAFSELLRAYDFASNVSCDSWEFAVEISSVIQPLDRTDLRWLVKRGLLLHARETSKPHDVKRSFVKQQSLRFSKRSCFVLSDTGVAVARSLEDGERLKQKPQPKWDGSRHKLWFGEVLVKHFKIPSGNQEMILAAFQEEGWPSRVDDPLPPHPEIDPKRRLHDAIKGLNRNQKTQALRFLGDGTGEAVCWEAFRGDQGHYRTESRVRARG